MLTEEVILSQSAIRAEHLCGIIMLFDHFDLGLDIYSYSSIYNGWKLFPWHYEWIPSGIGNAYEYLWYSLWQTAVHVL